MADETNQLLGVAAVGLAAGITIYATRELIDHSHRHKMQRGLGLFRR